MFHLRQLRCEQRKAMYLFQVTPCPTCGTVLFKTKPICSERMGRLVSVRVIQILGGGYITYGITTNIQWFSLWENPKCKRHVFQHHQCYILCFHEVSFMSCDVRQRHLSLVSAKVKHIFQNYCNPQVGSTNIICFQTTIACLSGFT